jgi:type IV secretion system protein VirB8
MQRKSKEQILEQERLLASPPPIDALTAQEMSVYEKAYQWAARWFEDNVGKQHKAKATMWRRIAMFNGVLAFMAIGAVMGLTPLKEFVPFAVRVNEVTGATDVLRPASETKSQEQIDDEFMLASYVRAREGYTFADHDAQYKLVELMSHDDTFTEYRNFQLSKKGYLEVLGDTRMIRTEINDINFLVRKNRTGTAQVLMTKVVLDKNGEPDVTIKPVKYRAMISYDYKKKPKTRGDGWLSPSGFGALTYSKTEEVGGKL